MRPSADWDEPVERRRNLIINTVLLLLFCVAMFVLWGQIQTNAQNRALAAGYTTLQRQVVALGGTPAVPPPGKVLENPSVIPSPGPSGPPGGAGPAGANASDAQVRAAVGAYFTAHPIQNGRDASPVDIAAAVAGYLQAHPAPAGPPGTVGPAGASVTGDQVAAAVIDYCTAHAGCAGPAGADGANGTDATDAQVAAAVKAYIDGHPLPLCPDGTTASAVTVLTTDPGGPTQIVACVVNAPAPSPT